MTNGTTLETPLSRNADQTAPSLGARRRLSSATRARWGVRVLATVIGLAVWALCVGVVIIGPKSPQGVVAVLLCLPLIGATALAMSGWGWFSHYRFGTYGNLIKFFALMGVAVTVVGFVAICYWTGIAILRRVSGQLL